MKICKKCGLYKDDSDFYKHKGICKSCHSLKSKKWRLENKNRVKETSRKSYLKHKERRRKPRREYASNRRKTDILFYLRSSISRSIRASLDSVNHG